MKVVMHTIAELVSASTFSCAVRSIDENGNDLTLVRAASVITKAKPEDSSRPCRLPPPRHSQQGCQTARTGLRDPICVTSFQAGSRPRTVE